MLLVLEIVAVEGLNTMLGAGVEMKEIIAICDDPKEVDWWKESLSAWGATKFIVTAAI